MPVLPEALSYEEVGGTKSDYAPIVDASTDRAADDVNKVFCSVAEMSRMCPRFWCKVTTTATGPTATIVAWEAVWKGSTPTVPVLTYTGLTGVWEITLPTSVNDEMGNSHYVNLRAAWSGGDEVCIVEAEVLEGSPNIILFLLREFSGATHNVGATFDIFAM